MISANELRIGNLANFHNDDTIFEVLGIHRNPDGIDCKSKHEETYIGLEHFSPIPLTQQILLKCGFVDNRLSLFNELNYMSLIWRHSKLWLTSEHEPSCLDHIKHLHQLQNLYYALTGTELHISDLK